MTSAVHDAALVLWKFHCVYDKLKPSDVIIGLGSYDVRVATRCAELFHQGYAEEILFTGGCGNWTHHLYPTSEAEAFRQHAIAKGVPEDQILLEPHASNIGENVRFSANLIPAAKRVIFVTKPQTQRRCQATAHKQWQKAHIMVTAPNTSFTDQPLPHHNEHALICEMVGDVERLRTYAELGFQTEVKLPDAVCCAFDTLVEAGFVDHLPR